MDELLVQIDREKYSIQTNFETIKAQLQETLNDYKGIVVDEKTIKQSKADLADLRKMAKEIDEVRKNIKAEWERPYEEFKAKCDELTGLINVPIAEIKGQLDEFEVKRISEKREHLNSLYSENIEEYAEYIPFESALSDKWKNVSYTDKDFLFDLSEKKVHIKTDLTAISALHSEIESEVIAAYKNSGNSLAVAIQKNSDYLSAKAMAEKKLAEEKKAEEVKEEVKADVVEQPEEKPFMNLPEEEPSFTFRVTGNEAIEMVKQFLDFNEIKYIEV